MMVYIWNAYSIDEDAPGVLMFVESGASIDTAKQVLALGYGELVGYTLGISLEGDAKRVSLDTWMRECLSKYKRKKAGALLNGVAR